MCLIASTAFVFFAVSPALAQQSAAFQGPVNTITIHNSEPGHAEKQELTYSGVCSGKPVGFRVHYTGAVPAVTVTVGRSKSDYGASQPFARELFAGKAVYQYWITCGGGGFSIWAWGALFNDAVPHAVRAEVDFGAGGKLVRYSGVIPEEEHDDVRSHLR